METRELYERVRKEKVSVSVVDGNLHLTGPSRAITPGLIAEVRAAKSEFIAFLLGPGEAAADPVPLPESALYPMQFIQRGRYAMYKLMPKCLNPYISKEVDTFNINNSYVYSGLDAACFYRAFSALVARYEILRTTFLTVNGQPAQQVHPFDPVKNYVDSLDLRAHESPAAELDRIRRSHKQHGFDFEAGPLFLATLVQTTGTDFVFLFTLNHIISDAFAVGFMETEFMVLYGDLVRGKEPALPPVGLQPKDFAAWEDAILRSEKGQKIRRYWKTELAGLGNFYPLRRWYAPSVPADLPAVSYRQDFRAALEANFAGTTEGDYRSTVGRYHRARSRPGNLIRVVIGEAVYQDLKALSVAGNASMSSLAVATLNLLQYRLSSLAETVVGLHLTNRLAHPRLAKISGCMSNTILVRSMVDPAVPVVDYVRTVQQKISGAYDCMIYPFECVLSDLDLSLDAIGSIYLNYIDRNLIHGDSIHDFSTWYAEDWGISFFELDFNIVEFRNGFELTCRYRKDLFGFATARDIVHLFESLLQGMAAAPGSDLRTVLAAAGPAL